MSNYQETTSQGTAWRRCNLITIENPMNGAQLARMFEEDVVRIDNRVIKSDIGHLQVIFSPDERVVLRDPDTGEPTGDYITHKTLYSMLYSLYMQTAIQRDTGAHLVEPLPV